MIEIKDLLLRFDKILLNEEGKREIVRNTISKTINIDINSQDIKIKNNIIYLNIKPIYKNEIFIKKEIIFLELKKLFIKNPPKNIH